MWRQGRRCYQQLSVQQGYNNQWPVMTGKVLNVGNKNPGVCHQSHYNTKGQRNVHPSSEGKNTRLSKNGRPWKKKGGYWKRTRLHKKQQTKHCRIAGHPWNSRFCRICQSHRRYFSRKRFFRRQRLLAFMRAAVKGRLRPMNLCGWRAPGMRAPRNTTQFIMHQVYQDMRQEEKKAAAAAAAAAGKREKEKSELQRSTGDNECSMVSASPSCMATISAMSPERNISSEDEELGEDEGSQTSQMCENIDLESHLSISCESKNYSDLSIQSVLSLDSSVVQDRP